jgi:hypothetical protein
MTKTLHTLGRLALLLVLICASPTYAALLTVSMDDGAE